MLADHKALAFMAPVADEVCYEILVHPGMLVHPNPEVNEIPALKMTLLK